jgi:adenosylhomocysteine nucleosidase
MTPTPYFRDMNHLTTACRCFFIALSLVLSKPAATRAQGILAPAQKTATDFPQKPRDLTAVIGAFELEVEVLKAQLEGRRERVVEGLRVYTGRLGGRRVVLVPSGIGKVNAAMTTTLVLEHFRPAQVLFTGIAGGMNPDLQPGDLVVGTRLVHHDYGRQTPEGFESRPTKNPYNFADNPVYFPADSALKLLAAYVVPKVRFESIGNRSPRVIADTIVTGDVFLADTKRNRELRQRFGADAVEMEGAAVAQICYQQRVPFLVIRSLSDNGDDSATLDFQKYGAVAARNSAALVRAILERLGR